MRHLLQTAFKSLTRVKPLELYFGSRERNASSAQRPYRRREETRLQSKTFLPSQAWGDPS